MGSFKEFFEDVFDILKVLVLAAGLMVFLILGTCVIMPIIQKNNVPQNPVYPVQVKPK